MAVTMTSIDVSLDCSRLFQANATKNYNDSDTFYVGEQTNGTNYGNRSLIKPDFSGIAAGQTFSSAILKLTPIVDLTSNARTMYACRCLRNVVYAQTTWNIFSTGNDWGTAGCSNNTTDYDGSVVIGSVAVSAAPTLNTQIEMTLDAAELQKLYDGTYTNNGLVLFVDTQLNDAIGYATHLHATAAYRPVITIEYSSGAVFVPGAMWF
jgi:hypothetical protein